MDRDHVRVSFENDAGKVGLTVPVDEAIRAVYDALEPGNDVEFLAMLALNEGLLNDGTPEELLTTYHEETGHKPRLPEEGEHAR